MSDTKFSAKELEDLENWKIAIEINDLINYYYDINLVTCGHCGAIFTHKLDENEFTCPHCDTTSEPCDFPDLFV